MSSTEPGAMYEEYWRFTALRHDIYLRRLAGDPGPWTSNPVLGQWRFTNAYRAADRVSQYLIRHVIYGAGQSADELLFRILLFKLFNKISTWELLQRELGPLEFATFDPLAADRLLGEARSRGKRIYSAAYIMPPVPQEDGPKHSGHLSLIMKMLDSGVSTRLAAAVSLEEVYSTLLEWPGIGPFLAYQLAIDINYSPLIDFDEDDFVVAGPGALDGLSKVWGAKHGRPTELIQQTVADQNKHFARLGIEFPGLFGRPLKLIDCQNLYCEMSKYTRVAFPHVQGSAGRTRIKQGYDSKSGPRPLAPPFFPPKWGLVVDAAPPVASHAQLVLAFDV